jgi:hypothetical protein
VLDRFKPQGQGRQVGYLVALASLSGTWWHIKEAATAMGTLLWSVDHHSVRVGREGQGVAFVTTLPTWFVAGGLTLGTKGARRTIEAISGGWLGGVAAITTHPLFKLRDALGQLANRLLQLLDQSNYRSRSTGVNGFDLFAGQAQVRHKSHTLLGFVCSTYNWPV